MTDQANDEAPDDVEPGHPQAREIARRRAEEIANEGQIVKGEPGAPEFYGPVNYFAQYSGITPPASEIRGLHQLEPKYADIVFEMAQREQQHRHVMDEAESRRSFELARGGQLAGLIVALAGFAVAVVLALLHEPAIAAVIGGLDIVSLVVVFVTGRMPARRAQPQPDGPSNDATDERDTT